MEDDALYDEQPASRPTDKDDENGPTGLLPKDFFVGKEPKPGDICSVEVLKIYDDQVEVKYITHTDEEEAEEGGEMAMAEEDAAIEDEDAMMA